MAAARDRAAEVKELLDAVQPLLLDFVRRADTADRRDAAAAGDDHDAAAGHHATEREEDTQKNLLLEDVGPAAIQEALFAANRTATATDLPETGQGTDGVLRIVKDVLRYSTNTWHQGFLDKLYHSTNPVGVAAELILGVLNTNVHVYKCSPALTVVEKATSRALAQLFGLDGPRAGGIVQAGGSASNLTALVIARNTLFPKTKLEGNGAVAGKGFVVFTSAHGHYSFEKACQVCGMGSKAAWSIPVNADTGCMDPQALDEAIVRAKDQGYTPLLVNGTAGTTVLGSYDAFDDIADVCVKHGLWFHIDASWGGGVVFSDRLRQQKLKGAGRADSIAFNPHKMLGVPIQCSFLLAKDLGTFWRSNTLPASYLFHAGSGGQEENEPEVWDLADLTLQCGRRGDALKLALGWVYYGREGYASQIESAFDLATYFASLVEQDESLVLVGKSPPPCLQVCFYSRPTADVSTASISARTQAIAARLVDDEFLVDYAKNADGACFLRAVVGLETTRSTIDRLVASVLQSSRELDASS